MHIHDVLIIGAGPAGLAAAARLREHTPSATFTDDEHQRYHWLRKHGRKINIKNYRTNKNSLPTPPSSPESSECGCAHREQPKHDLDMLVLDADGKDWMAKWKRLFKRFEIDFLRSPMFFHVDPADRDGLLGYTYEEEREKELLALPGCTGKEISKHKRKKTIKSKGRFLGRTPDVDERDRKDYYTPGVGLFHAHCEEVARRYGLEGGLVREETVVDIAYSDLGEFENGDTGAIEPVDEDTKVFRVATNKGIHFASIVILAIGPGNAPSIPFIPSLPSHPHEGYAHALQLTHFPPKHVMSKVKARQTTNIMIVGGGLTSVQLADVALKRGVSRVWLLMRGPLKIKYFDMDLDWVGKFRNYKQAEFWSADSDEARPGMAGSVTPRYRKVLDAHVATGKISLHTHTTLQSVVWNGGAKTWACNLSNDQVRLPEMDYITFATGVQTDMKTLPFLQTIQQQHPIESVGGLPCLNDDLMWNDDVPLFVTGRLAGLRLGPGAPNLVGARTGAERIAWNVDDVLRKLGKRRNGDALDEESSDSGDERVRAYASGRDNRFQSLFGIDDV